MKKIILIIALAATQSLIKAQDIHFSQFYNAPLLLNPAMVGIFNGDHRAQINYKDQWRSVAAPYKTFAASYDTRIMYSNVDKFGIGASFFSDAAGDLKMGTNQFNIMASYQKQLTPEMGFAFGIEGSIAQKKLSSDVSLQQWGNQYDGTAYNPNLPTGEVNTIDNFTFGDFTVGTVWNYGYNEKYITANDQFNIQLGLAYHHLNRPKQSFWADKSEKLYSKIVFHGLSSIGLSNTNTSIVPQFMYFNQGPAQELNLGTMFKFKLQEGSQHTMWIKEAFAGVGGFYRWKDSFILATALEFQGYALGISYDLNTSNLKEASKLRGGIEFSLRYIPPPVSRFYGKTPRIR
ncbi:MAG: PorP/SprF family type IX secretion system membrane protein [Bacteroidales bacterium]|nr:PorP/SprF family type IX secretion system membrane protein [Bacteroidales bacterium]